MAMPVDLRVLLLDGNGNPSSMIIHLDDGVTLADATASGQAAAPVIDALTLDKITGVDIVYHVDLSALTLKADAGTDSDNEDGAMFVFSDADGRLYRSRIPAFDHTFVSPSSKDVDTTATEVTDYTGGIIGGFGGGPEPVSKANVDITTLRSAKQSFAKNRKGRRK
jgi:hypothetical protein